MPDSLTRRDALRGIGLGAGGLALTASAISPTAAGNRSCPKTAEYWRTHTEEWVDGRGDLLDELWIAGDPYPTLPQFADDDEVTVLDILEETPDGDKSIVMVQQRIAAQLNYWAAVTCRRGDLAYARATAWLLALDEPLVADDGTIGTGRREWPVEVPETRIDTPSITVSVDAETYGKPVKDKLREYNEDRLCPCEDED